MPPAAGTRLGAYEIVGVLGAGGMGEVYRARDTRLGREVAIKVLPDRFASDPERIARFQREAQVLASLNDPHIGGLYGLEESNGMLALVLELVDGPTLADRIARGALPFDEALVIARQMALAIEAAHEKGIIHRDLKPSNVKVRTDGAVKILDFGLAKLLETDQPSSSLTMSPTLSVRATYAGTILGTAAYMSPEQARGKPVDRRTDIWAFGCVLYEMLSGKQTFAAGETVSDAIAAIIRSEPDWSALPASTPEPIRKLLGRCLAKDPRDRLHDIADARLEISDALTVGGRGGPNTAPASRLRRGIARIAAAAALAAAMVAGMSYRNVPADTRVYRSEIVPPARLDGDPSGRLALSPDGRRLAFLAPGTGGRRLLWVRSLDSVSAQPLAGTEEATYPFWSPDSGFLAFIADGKLKRIEAAGGSAFTLADAGSGTGAWSRDDVILFTPRQGSSALFRIPAGGGTPSPVTTLADGETRHNWPAFLPDGRHFLYLASRAATPVGIYVGTLDSIDRRRLLDGGSNVTYSQGVLLFMREATLVARAFDPGRLEFTGEPVPLAENLLTTSAQTGAFAASNTGTLIYQIGVLGGQLTWLDTSGKRLEALGDRALYRDVQISPDGTNVAASVASDVGGNRDIWLLDVRRGVRTRLTFEAADDHSPVWSPDGRWVVFASNRKGHFDLYRKEIAGAEADEVMLADTIDKVPLTWSPDGRFILYNAGTETRGNDLWMLPLSPNAKPEPFLQTAFNETQAAFSPDGRWVAYTSSESGRNEVYVAPFPGGGGKSQVSTAGGISPRWRRDGKELFYRAAQARDLMAASVFVRERRLEFGAPRPLFDVGLGGGNFRYDISADGQRFLVNGTADENATLTLVVNWPAALKK